MKKNYLILLGLFLFISAKAQTIDSVAVEVCKHRYDSDHDEFSSQQIDSISQRLIQQSLIQSWISNQWVNSLLITYSYDTNLRNDSILTQHWNGSTWVNDSLITKSYDPIGNLLSYTNISSFRYLYFYDSNNNDTLIQYQTWNAGWQNSTQSIKNFNAFNKIILDIEQSWFNSTWQNISKEEFFYNASQHLTQRLIYGWNSNNISWEDSLQFNYYQDAFQNDTSIVRHSWVLNSWMQVEKDSFTYDSWNHPNLYARYYFSNSYWYKDFQQDLFYDTLGRFLGSYTFCCSGPAETSISYSYNADGSLIDESVYNITQGGSQHYRNCHYYSFDFPNNNQLYFFGENSIEKCSSDTVQLGVYILGGTAPLHFQWSPSNELNNDTIESPLAFCDSTTTYSLAVTDQAGYTHYWTYSVLVTPDPEVTISGSNGGLICGASPVTLTATTSGTSYFKWYCDGTLLNVGNHSWSINVSVPGTYYIIANGNTGCQATSPPYIVLDGNPHYTTAFNNASVYLACDGSLSVTPTTHITGILWTSGDTTLSLNNLCAGTYYFTITDTSGCFISDSIIISQPPPICSVAITFISPIMCHGDCNLDLTASVTGVSPFTYQWSNGATTQVVNNLCAGTYTVTTTDSVGCISTNTVVMTDPPPITTNIISDYSNCSCSFSLIVNGGSPPYAYQWCDGSTGPVLNWVNCLPGLCAVYVTDGNGCFAIDTVIVTPPLPIAINVQATPTSCAGCSDGTLISTATGGTPPFTYLVSPTGLTCDSCLNMQAGTYQVCVTDINGCTACASNTILDDPSGTIDHNVNGIIKIYPNPFVDESVLEVNLEILKLNPEFIITDIIGNKITSIRIEQLITTISRKDLAAGVYFYRLRETKKSIAHGKLVVVD